MATEMLTGALAPEFSGLKGWLNTSDLTLAGLKGKIVLLDFWTYSCVNCIRTLPHMKQLFSRYAGDYFTLVGVHTPEFEFEKKTENVAEAVKRFDIRYPVALDSDNTTWKRFGNQYWPRQTLVDAKGWVRWEHAGEGDYDKMEQAIRRLLEEAGHFVPRKDFNFSSSPGNSLFRQGNITPEIYTGSLRSKGFGNGQVCVPGSCTRFIDTGRHERDIVYFSGDWEQFPEHVMHETKQQGYASLKYSAANANVVMGTSNGPSAMVRVLLDEKPLAKDLAGLDIEFDAQGAFVNVGEHRLYDIVRTRRVETHELRLVTEAKNLSLYTFTFG